MELRGLCPVLACLQLLPRLVWSEAPDSSPGPSVPEEPSCPTLQQMCSAPVRTGILPLPRYKGGAAPQTSHTGQIPRLGPQLAGPSTCSSSGERKAAGGAHPPRATLSPLRTAAPPSAPAPDPLPPPTLSLDSQYPVYYQGERLQLSCSAPSGEAVAGYRFYKARGTQTPEELSSPSGAGRLELRAETGTEGPYTCRYWRAESGQEIASRDSNQVHVTVQAAPAAPTLSLHPAHPIYISGERVTLRCSAPGAKKLQVFKFYREQEGLTQERVPVPEGGAQLELEAEKGRAGEYTCTYQSLRSGRQILSERSRPVSLSVQDPPAAPSLSLSPQHPIYLPGESVTLTCSPPWGAPAAAGFWFSGAGERKISSGSSHTHPLHITGPRDSRSYTCAYWVHLHGREIQSLASRPVSIHVTAPPPSPTLSLGPPHAVYLPGEPVQLSCSAPGAQDVSAYRFYKQMPEQSSEELPSPRGGPRLEIRAAVGDPGTYTCRYWSRGSGRELPSGISQPLSVPVTELPPAPQIALDPPHPVFLPGERVTLWCSAPPRQEVARYGFYRQPGELIGAGVPDPTGSALMDLSAGPGTAGLYVCVYWARRAGREVSSKESQPVNLSLTERPSAPRIALVSPHPVFLPGDQGTLRCSAPPGQEVAGYRFYRQPGELMGAGVPDPTRGARLDLSAGPGTAGLYVCVYRAWRAGREVPSEESRPVNLSLTDHPPKPSVSLSPDSPVYVSGDRVEILCSAPPTASPEWFSFYQSGKVIGHQPGNTSMWQLDLQHIGTGKATRSFSCTYEQRIQRRPVPSHAGDPVSIPVFPAPAAPSLRLIPPHPLYVPGETVTAECVAPAGPYEPRAHWLQRDEEPGAEMPGPRHNLTVTHSTRGRYWCGYSTELHGRGLQSPLSPPVVLEVTDPPPPPELSVDPPSGVVSEGAPLLLTCRAPGGAVQPRFHFYQDGAELSPPEPGASPERRFPQATPSQSGNFTCGYEEPVGGRWIWSPQSRAVNVAMAAWSLPIPLLAGCGGAAFALVLFFIVCLHWRKKEANLQHDRSYWKSRELRQSQMKRGSADNIHIGLQQKVGDWPQVSQDWGLLPKLQGEGPRLGRVAPKGHKEEDDADSGAEFEFPDGDPTYVKLNFSCSTFRQGEDRPATPESPYNAIAP